VRAVEDFDVGPAAVARAGDDIGEAVVIDVGRADADAAAEGRAIGKKAAQERQVLAAEDFDVRPAARSGPGDDIHETVAVDVAGRNEYAAGESGAVGKEAVEERQVLAAEDFDVWSAAGAGPRDYVVDAVAVDVAGGDTHAAVESGGIGQEIK